eukprot:4338575-Heterocapsa_arctica.AAC.1
MFPYKADGMRQWKNGVDNVRKRRLLQVNDNTKSSGDARYPGRQRRDDRLHQMVERQGHQLEEQDEHGEGEGGNDFTCNKAKREAKADKARSGQDLEERSAGHHQEQKEAIQLFRRHGDQ